MKKMDEIKPHDFDGIQEYDNDLPRWWLGTFIFSILFAFGYWFYFFITGAGPNLKQELEADRKIYEEASEHSASGAALTDDDIKKMIADTDDLEKSKALFMQNCMACHGMQGQGVIGPNLTDNAWIHGGKPQDIYSLIQVGVASKGMPTWKGLISDEQTRGLVAYIKSLAGTNPPGAKAPEGNVE